MVSDGLCRLSKRSTLSEYIHPSVHRHGTWWSDQPRIRRQRKYTYTIYAYIHVYIYTSRLALWWHTMDAAQPFRQTCILSRYFIRSYKIRRTRRVRDSLVSVVGGYASWKILDKLHLRGACITRTTRRWTKQKCRHGVVFDNSLSTVLQTFIKNDKNAWLSSK